VEARQQYLDVMEELLNRLQTTINNTTVTLKRCWPKPRSCMPQPRLEPTAPSSRQRSLLCAFVLFKSGSRR
jgi:hypothetical protein